MTQVYIEQGHESALDAIAMDVHFSLPQLGEKEQFEAIRKLWFAFGHADDVGDEQILRSMQEARRTF